VTNNTIFNKLILDISKIIEQKDLDEKPHFYILQDALNAMTNAFLFSANVLEEYTLKPSHKLLEQMHHHLYQISFDILELNRQDKQQ